jgi:hypothetical protein
LAFIGTSFFPLLYKNNFSASGDLRHVVRTINALPSDYSGNLKVLITDKMPHTACRNMVLLIILRAIADDILAADISGTQRS